MVAEFFLKKEMKNGYEVQDQDTQNWHSSLEKWEPHLADLNERVKYLYLALP